MTRTPRTRSVNLVAMVCQGRTEEKVPQALRHRGNSDYQGDRRPEAEERCGDGEEEPELVLPVTVEPHGHPVSKQLAGGIHGRRADVHADAPEKIRGQPQRDGDRHEDRRPRKRRHTHRAMPGLRAVKPAAVSSGTGWSSGRMRSRSSMSGRISWSNSTMLMSPRSARYMAC